MLMRFPLAEFVHRALALLALASACVAVSPPTHVGGALRFPGHTEMVGPPSEIRGALSLSNRNVLEMPPKLAREISAIDFFQGRARLADGRCLQLRHETKTRKFTGAILSAEPSACEALLKYPLLVSGRCSADEKNRSIGTWRVGCRVTGKGRSVIVATKLDDASSKLELASLPDEELIAVGVIGLHDQGLIRTMGIRSDGKIILSYYTWFNGPYRAVPKAQ